VRHRAERLPQPLVPITDCLPTTLAIDKWQLARDAHTALRGLADTPVLSGELTTDSRRGTVRLDYVNRPGFERGFRQALFGLVWFRKRVDLTALSTRYVIGTFTALPQPDQDAVLRALLQ